MSMRGQSQTHQNHTTMDGYRRWRSSMVEQLICNQQVAGSSPIASSAVENDLNGTIALTEPGFARRSPSREGLGTLLGFLNKNGRVPERSKGTDCKSVATGFEGSNPSPSTAAMTGDEFAGVAQLVELQPSKLDVAGSRPVSRSHVDKTAHLAQLAEHVLGKDEVTRSIRVVGSRLVMVHQ